MYEVKYISNEKGEKTDVIIPYDEYIELLEDLEDLKDIIACKDEETISHHEVKILLHIDE